MQLCEATRLTLEPSLCRERNAKREAQEEARLLKFQASVQNDRHTADCAWEWICLGWRRDSQAKSVLWTPYQPHKRCTI